MSTDDQGFLQSAASVAAEGEAPPIDGAASMADAAAPESSTDSATPAVTGAASPADAAPSDAQPPVQPGTEPHSKKRRSWKRIVANLMILAGVLVVLYPVYTFGYTWYHQRELRHQLSQASPQITSADANTNTGSFVQLVTTTTTSVQQTSPSTTQDAQQAQQAAADAAAQAQLAAFKAAADAFATTVAGKTGMPIGKIVIPSIGMNVVMVEGTGKGDLKEGPGHWPETPFPGEGGNFVVSGHRTTYGAPFFKLNDIHPGDEIDLILPYAVARYKVTWIKIVLPTEVGVVAQQGIEQVSLAACHPIYSASHRIVVQADLVDFKLLSQ